MEFKAVVKTLLRQLDEVAYMDGRIETGQLDADRALRRGEHGDLITGRLVCRSVKFSHVVSFPHSREHTYSGFYQGIPAAGEKPFNIHVKPSSSCCALAVNRIFSILVSCHSKSCGN